MKGDIEVARRLADKAAAHSDPAIAERGRGLLRTLDAPLDRGTIGLLLPMSDKYARAGTSIANAFQLGYGNAPLRVKIYDTGGTPELAVAALERAVLEDGVIAVVGPLLSTDTEAVVSAAETMAVPLVSLSQSFENPEDGMWGFQAMYTRGDQVDAIIEWSMEVEGRSSFAVFGPDSEFGSTAATMFEEAVLERGGTITAVAAYPDAEADLLPFTQEFGERQGDETDLRRLPTSRREQGPEPRIGRAASRRRLRCHLRARDGPPDPHRHGGPRLRRVPDGRFPTGSRGAEDPAARHADLERQGARGHRQPVQPEEPIPRRVLVGHPPG